MILRAPRAVSGFGDRRPARDETRFIAAEPPVPGRHMCRRKTASARSAPFWSMPWKACRSSATTWERGKIRNGSSPRSSCCTTTTTIRRCCASPTPSQPSAARPGIIAGALALSADVHRRFRQRCGDKHPGTVLSALNESINIRTGPRHNLAEASGRRCSTERSHWVHARPAHDATSARARRRHAPVRCPGNPNRRARPAHTAGRPAGPSETAGRPIYSGCDPLCRHSV